MSQRDTGITLRQMRDHAREAVEMTATRTMEDLARDRQLALAITRLLEIVGEAANRVPLSEQERHSEIPWKSIRGLRNRLIHGYDVVDWTIIWRILNDDLPPLIESLERIVAAEYPDE
jgi:uncharacterized protein with HEPN domain